MTKRGHDGTSKADEPAQRKRAEGALLRRLRLPSAAEEEGGGGATRLAETEAYRVWDVATSEYHAAQTRGMRSGRLAFVAQGGHGAMSLMVVGATFADGDQVTFLVRATA